MKLLTHNFLSSKFLKNAVNGYPLKLHVVSKEVANTEFDKEFIVNVLPKVDYNALRTVANEIGEGSQLPESMNGQEIEQISDEFLQELHRILFCIDIIEGELECPDTGRRFPIKDGIPNMLCTEAECA